MLKKSKQLADDLFEKSSMSFGEHLDELRKALTKAFIWLGIGTAVGLYFGERIVQQISAPLEVSLKGFRIAQAEKLFKSKTGVAPSKEIAQWMVDENVVPERIFIDPSDLIPTPGNEEVGPDGAAAKRPNPWRIDDEKLPQLRPVLVWKEIANKLLAFTMLEGFMIWLKAGVIAGAVLASPGIFWHIWQFLAAGLYPHERRYVYWYLPLSLFLFFGGVSLCYFVIFPLVLSFLLTYNLGLDIDIAPRLSDYVSFALILPLGFGIAFQLPIAMVALHRFGIISVETYTKNWRVSVLVIAFLSMVLTPAEPYTMIGMFVPLVFLYFFGIFLCRFMPTGPGLGSQALDPQG